MGSFCAAVRIVVYSSIDRPWSVTAFAMASPASPWRRCFSATGASDNCWSYFFLITDAFLSAAPAASSFLSGIIVGVVVGLGVVADGPAGDCCCACAAGMTKRPAAVRVRAHHVPNRVVDCMSKLLLGGEDVILPPTERIRHATGPERTSFACNARSLDTLAGEPLVNDARRFRDRPPRPSI